MTVRVTTLKGPDAGAYYVEALPSYYVDVDEPIGVWRGSGAEELGLSGEIGDAAFLSLMAGVLPGTEEALGRRYGEASVRGFDITASAPKSVSVLFALGDEDVRRAVLQAHDAAVGAMVDWVEGHAHTRFRIDGHVAVVDAQGIVAACFRQHTSRAMDPQLHTHVVIPNRVLAPDGRWLALDARIVKVDQRTLSALYHASLRAELTRSLAVTWHEPANGIAEMAAVPTELLREFSQRGDAVAERFEEKLERFVHDMGYEPTPRQRWQLEREAVTDSRPAKAHADDAASLHQDWADQANALGYDPADVVAETIGLEAGRTRLDARTREVVIDSALAALVERQSTWRPAELVRELAAAVPSDVRVSADKLVPWLDDLAAEVIDERLVDLSRPVPDDVLLRRDGRPVSEAVTDRALTTPDILAEEEALIAWAAKRMEEGGAHNAAVLEAASALSEPQLELAAAVAGTADLVLGVGPAGSGKTAALAPAAEQLRTDGRAIFGAAPSATAADVLATETGIDADTLDKLLIEHHLDRLPDHRYDLPVGATVIVDEAAMVPTPKLAELADLAERRDWRVVLLGDQLQFSAVGRGGMFAHLVETYGASELGRVHRFANTWEAEASLRLRRGDASVLELYDEHGRLGGGTRRQMEKAVLDAWSYARAQGQTVAMMAPTNQSVESLNKGAQSLRFRASELDLSRPHVSAGPYEIYAGDVVATRQNERQLRTDRGYMVKNRDRWEVAAVYRDGSIAVSGRTGAIRLPGDYVKEHVELAYAETSHANQGRTVDRSLLLLDGPTDVAGVYVPLSRGRQGNEAYVVTKGEQTVIDVLTEAMSRHWIDDPAVVRRAELQRAQDAGGQVRAMEAEPLAPGTVRKLLERETAINEHVKGLELEVRRLERELTRNEAEGPRQFELIAHAERTMEDATNRLQEYDRPFRRRHHETEIDWARTQIRNAERDIEKSRAAIAKAETRAPELERELAGARAALGQRPALEAERHGTRERLGADLAARGAELRRDPPEHIVNQLGGRPPRGRAAAAWDEAVARIDQHRTAFGITDTRDALGRTPRHDDGAYAASHKAATQAAERLERVLGRDLGIQPPSRSLSIELSR
jgi:conjugative relaxase-like TrwC/TraI family protein